MLGGSDSLKLKGLNDFEFFYRNATFHFKLLIDGLESCGLLVDYCDVLSAIWTLILTAPIYCKGSISKQVM